MRVCQRYLYGGSNKCFDDLQPRSMSAKDIPVKIKKG
jgi:hypothetical protein